MTAADNVRVGEIGSAIVAASAQVSALQESMPCRELSIVKTKLDECRLWFMEWQRQQADRGPDA